MGAYDMLCIELEGDMHISKMFKPLENSWSSEVTD